MSLLALALALQRQASEKKQESTEAIDVLEQIRCKYGDVEWQDGKLSESLEPLIFTLKYLQVGRTPPDIIGKDVNGAEFKLSDYRGKVVVLDFWGDWCPYCREMYPTERNLLKQMKDKPVVIVGVNCDEPRSLKKCSTTARSLGEIGPTARTDRSSRLGRSPAIPRSMCSMPPA